MVFRRLYREQVVHTGETLYLPDAAVDPEWRYSDGRLQFGRGVYPGYLSAA